MNLGIERSLMAAAVGLLAIGVACSSGSTPQETTAAATIEVTKPSADAAPPTEKPAEVKVGNKVGNRAPEYALSLVGGSTVTSDSLVSESRPVFLFFLAKW